MLLIRMIFHWHSDKLYKETTARFFHSIKKYYNQVYITHFLTKVLQFITFLEWNCFTCKRQYVKLRNDRLLGTLRWNHTCFQEPKSPYQEGTQRCDHGCFQETKSPYQEGTLRWNQKCFQEPKYPYQEGGVLLSGRFKFDVNAALHCTSNTFAFSTFCQQYCTCI